MGWVKIEEVGCILDCLLNCLFKVLNIKYDIIGVYNECLNGWEFCNMLIVLNVCYFNLKG